MSLHKNSAVGDVHQIANWRVADTAALDALVVTEEDTGKIAFQEDSESLWFLTDEVAPTWLLLNPSISGLPAGGTAGQVLVKQSGSDYDADWAAGSQSCLFNVYRPTSNQVVTTSTYTKIQFSAENFDPSNVFDAVTNYRFQPTIAGYYDLSWLLTGSGTTVTGVATKLYKNGASVAEGTWAAGALGFGRSGSSYVVHLNGSSDYLEVFGYVNATGTAAFVFGSDETYFCGHLIKAD